MKKKEHMIAIDCIETDAQIDIAKQRTIGDKLFSIVREKVSALNLSMTEEQEEELFSVISWAIDESLLTGAIWMHDTIKEEEQKG